MFTKRHNFKGCIRVYDTIRARLTHRRPQGSLSGCPRSNSSREPNRMIFWSTLSQTSPGFFVSAVEVLKTLWDKGEIARNKQFLLFPQCFLPVWKSFCNIHQIRNCRLQMLWIWENLKFVIWERVNTKLQYVKRSFNSFPHNDTFWRPLETSLLKTLWEMEKLLVTRNFSFSHSVFYPFG